MNVDAMADLLGRRFHLDAPPVLAAPSLSKRPIVFTRLRSDTAFADRTRDVPPDDAFALQVSLQPLHDVDIWRYGRHSRTNAVPGSTHIFDLRENPTTFVHDPFDMVRFYISQDSLEDLAYSRGLPRVSGLRQQEFGTRDDTMHGLALSLRSAFSQPGQASSLFVDFIALAFHSHALGMYGNTVQRSQDRHVGLSPRHLRRASEAMVADLEGNPTIADIAGVCGLSPSHFARAFKRSTGLAPHQWLTRKRVDKARALLKQGSVGLADIAISCGFNDQSHLTRVFSRHEGHTPGQWRRVHRT